MYKIASYELTSDRLLIEIAKKKKPIILSTGMAYLEEIAHAVRTIQEAGNEEIILLHCVSIYPPKKHKDINLKAIKTLQESFQLPTGYSDHTHPGFNAAVLGAVALGACIIERHLTDSREGGSHDDPNSLLPEEFAKMVMEIRALEGMLSGTGIKQPICYKDHENDEIADRWTRRSIYAAMDVKKGTKISKDMLVLLRPTGGIEPKYMKIILGKKNKKDLKKGECVTWEHFFD
jgi:sialic acid synthase SpsE